MAADLVAGGVDVLVAVGANGAPYAKAATTKIPVVFAIVPDPLGSDLVKSLARPEANVTGFSNSASDLIGKRLELLRELVPGLSRVALLVNSNSKLAAPYSDNFQAAASNLGLSASTFRWLGPDDLEAVFAAMKTADVQAFMINPDGWAFTYRAAIAKLATANRLVLSSWSRQTFDAGAFMSYGVDHDAICRRVAVEGRQAWRPPGRAADKIRIPDQPAHRACHRQGCATHHALARRRSVRVKARLWYQESPGRRAGIALALVARQRHI
jgi:putative tryptophan/tyrosine transport system substrate-binding protein